MSSERIIDQADVASIYNALGRIDQHVDQVFGQVDTIGNGLVATRQDLNQLWQEFRDYVAGDLRAKELQLAETRRVKIHQDLETTFGYYAEIRRRTTGILQASDISLVRQDTVATATEELMLAAPRYWLAPGLVALAAWLCDKKELAQRALAEAIKRDDEKTSLFFALVCRRVNRLNASKDWLDRFLAQQDPTGLDRQTIVVIDAVANGIFGADARSHCTKRIEEWISELSNRAGFIEEQRDSWKSGLLSKVGHIDCSYTYLRKNSATWEQIQVCLQGATLHKISLEHFEQIFSGGVQPSLSVKSAVDELLDRLVSHFDDEELPLRRQERLCSLIIEENGDKKTAENRLALENKTQEDMVSFTQLLTNAAIHPETSHASKATQRYAIALSKHWIVAAHEDLTASNRASVPARIEFEIESWSGVTIDGRNETELAASLDAHYQKREAVALSTIKFDAGHWVGLSLCVLCILYGLFDKLNFLPLIIGAGFGLWFFIASQKIKKAREKIQAEFAEPRKIALQLLSAILAEIVDFRAQYKKMDAISVDFQSFMAAITPEQHLLSHHDTHRNIMTTAASVN